jgi:predicted dehydrogenase
VDLVVVTVKVPAHVELVRAALDAGKHVYCEWPLATTAAEAADLAEAARRAGVHAVVGLQARFAAAVERARRLIAEGAIGTVLSANLYSTRKTPDFTTAHACTRSSNASPDPPRAGRGHGAARRPTTAWPRWGRPATSGHGPALCPLH